MIFRIFTFIRLFILLPVPQSIALFPKITIQEDGCQILIIVFITGEGGGGGEILFAEIRDPYNSILLQNFHSTDSRQVIPF